MSIFRRNTNWLVFFIVLGFLFAVRAAPAIGSKEKEAIPNVDFEIAAKRVDHGAAGVYIFKLYCRSGTCGLEQLSLNECENTPLGLAFSPKMFKWRTCAGCGNLEVKLINDNTLEVKVFQGTHKMLPAILKLTFIPELPVAKRLTGFVASGFLDFSTKEGLRIHTPIQFVALPEPIQTIKMDCPALLNGLDKEAR